MRQFDVESTQVTMRMAASLAGINADDAQLVRLGENAVFRLVGQAVVARVARSAKQRTDVQRELRLADWLAAHDIPVARPVVPNVVEADGRLVTFWEEIPGPRASTPEELGAALRRFHALSPSAELGLPRIDPLARVEERIAAARALSTAERDALIGYAAVVGQEFAHAVFDLEMSMVHGDGHVDNLVRGSNGRLAFVDLEECAYGQPEWDLVLTAIERDCGWVTAEQYEQFSRAYGYDVTTSPGYEVLRRVRLLRMTSWLAQKAAESAEVLAEVRHRIQTLQTDQVELSWNAY
ncbi:aminoglycoside phosphotransferase family protein (plasmid) [Streptosporangium sp. NBC_01495]|uniref:phosphotransferase enzyme family protein n=1 Tax=Streptosporangium sp. NBC_01495 TaxID=2903899 RepID=UPI002E309A3B|nr:aminoglycoside phosphotransferase family protein [Streptosporangium sp. NBC_01495]